VIPHLPELLDRRLEFIELRVGVSQSVETDVADANVGILGVTQILVEHRPVITGRSPAGPLRKPEMTSDVVAVVPHFEEVRLNELCVFLLGQPRITRAAGGFRDLRGILFPRSPEEQMRTHESNEDWEYRRAGRTGATGAIAGTRRIPLEGGCYRTAPAETCV
jgi:hypothetical protein